MSDWPEQMVQPSQRCTEIAIMGILWDGSRVCGLSSWDGNNCCLNPVGWKNLPDSGRNEGAFYCNVAALQ